MSDQPSIPDTQIRLAENATDVIGFESMTFPMFAPLLQRIGVDPRFVAAIAQSNQQPLGLALAEVVSSGEEGLIRSIYVEPSARRKGVALELLRTVERRLQDQGVKQVTGSYAKNPVVEGLLARDGWVPPQPSMYLFHVNKAGMEAMEHSPVYREANLGPGQEIVSWKDLTPEDHAAIAEAVVRFHVPTGLTAATEPHLIDPELSLALRIDGMVYVWLLVHRTGPERRRYTGLYARPDSPVKGLAIRLVFESLRRRLIEIRNLPDADATWGCPANMPMAGFCLRRLVPYLPGIKVTETMLSGKMLGDRNQ